MPEPAYSNREIDGKHEAVLEKIDDLKNVLELKMNLFEHDTRDSLSRIETQVSYTNGKVRKLIIAIIFLAGLVIGLGVTNASVVLPILGLGSV